MLDYLAESYLELKNYEKSLQCVEQSNTIQPSISAQCLKAKLMIAKNEDPQKIVECMSHESTESYCDTAHRIALPVLVFSWLSLFIDTSEVFRQSIVKKSTLKQ